MLKVEIQAVVLRTMHNGQVHRLCGRSVGIPFGFIADASQLIQSLFLQRHRLISQ